MYLSLFEMGGLSFILFEMGGSVILLEKDYLGSSRALTRAFKCRYYCIRFDGFVFCID